MLLAGCGGGGPRLAHADAAPMIALADQIAAEGPCAQTQDIRRLQTRLIALVNAHKIPPALQEPLSSGVNALVVETPPCLPPIPATTSGQTPTLVVPEHGKQKHDKHGHGDGGGD